jgi:hypothetical protein
MTGFYSATVESMLAVIVFLLLIYGGDWAIHLIIDQMLTNIVLK